MPPLTQATVHETGVSLVVNGVIGMLMGWLTLPKQGVLMLLGGPESAGFGVLAVSVIFAFVGTLLISTMLQKKVAKGGLILDKKRKINRFIALWPNQLILRALCLTLFSVCVIAPLFLFSLNIMIGSQWTYAGAMTLQGIYPMILALIITPIIVQTAVRYQ